MLTRTVVVCTTVSHPGHTYTNCMGSTSYFGRFNSYGDSGSFSGAAKTDTNCSTTFSPPTETTLTTYRRVNYTIAKGDQALYLLSCKQKWKPSGKQRAAMVIGAIAGGGAGRQSDAGDGSEKDAGTWSYCPAFGIGAQYTLTIRSTSDARLESSFGEKPIKLEYLSSAALAQGSQSAPVAQAQNPPPSARERAQAAADAPRLHRVLEENHALSLAKRHQEALDDAKEELEAKEFERRKKQAADLGMKPGTPEYVHYVANGKAIDIPERATVHITSTPTGGEIYVDGKFVGNTPSDITLAAGEHILKITMEGKVWSRSIEITAGEVSVHADVTEK